VTTAPDRTAALAERIFDWLSQMPDVVARLERTRHPRIADVGCGEGFSTLAMAGAFLDAHVDGFDLDARSLDDARLNAVEAGLGGRVRFLEADAGGLVTHGPYDLVLLLEALHDLADPVAGLSATRAALNTGGAVLLADERVPATCTAPGDQVERMAYGWSITHRLPTQLAEQPAAALDTILRSDAIHRLARSAGFARVEVLPVDSRLLRLYRLDP
jgi:SAM-dependent methyltransferase